MPQFGLEYTCMPSAAHFSGYTMSRIPKAGIVYSRIRLIPEQLFRSLFRNSAIPQLAFLKLELHRNSYSGINCGIVANSQSDCRIHRGPDGHVSSATFRGGKSGVGSIPTKF